MKGNLKINIQQIEKQHQPSEYQNSPQTYERDDQEESENEEGSENQKQSGEQQSEQLEISNFRGRQNIQIFGDERYKGKSNKNMKLPSYYQDDSFKNTKKMYQQSQISPLTYKKQKANFSSIDDEVNMIINKVLNKPAIIARPGKDTSTDIEKIKKIDRVNKDLLSQNAELISELNKLQSRLTQLTSKLPVQKKQKQKDLAQRLQTYRDRLSKALHLNSKLSSRLSDQKSKSELYSQTQRQIKKSKHSTVFIEALSTIKSPSRLKIQSNRLNTSNVCELCCQKVSKKKNTSQSSNSPLKSPVLQVNDYCVTSNQQINTSQFNPKQNLSYQSKQCQADLNNFASMAEYEYLERQQKLLEEIVQKNNRIIHNFQERFFTAISSF